MVVNMEELLKWDGNPPTPSPYWREWEIRTWGDGVGSPYPWRRKFSVEVEGAKKIKGYLKILASWVGKEDYSPDLNGPIEIDGYNPREWCTFCKNADPNAWFNIIHDGPPLCFRHRSLYDFFSMLGAESNHEYVYVGLENFEDHNRIIYVKVGANEWKGVISSSKAVIRRPNGLRFTFNNYNPISGYGLIVSKLHKFLLEVYNSMYRRYNIISLIL